MAARVSASRPFRLTPMMSHGSLLLVAEGRLDGPAVARLRDAIDSFPYARSVTVDTGHVSGATGSAVVGFLADETRRSRESGRRLAVRHPEPLAGLLDDLVRSTVANRDEVVLAP